MEKLQNIIVRALIAFALVSIGFALGKNSVKHSPGDGHDQTANGSYVQVYYMHSTFRCVTCNTIEQMTKELLSSKYAEAMNSQVIRWNEIDFQASEELAQKFEVIASCVVVAQVNQGVITGYKRLDDTWTKMNNKDEFDGYVAEAIDSFLNPSGKKI